MRGKNLNFCLTYACVIQFVLLTDIPGVALMADRRGVKSEAFDDDIRRNVLFLRRRDRLVVYVSILEAIREEMRSRRFAIFTHVMYGSNMSAMRLKERLQELSYLELVEWNEHGVRLTEKGINFLREVKKLFRVLEEYGFVMARYDGKSRTLF